MGARRGWSSACSEASRGRRSCATEIERALGLSAINFYGLSEMCGPGVATECLVARRGLHVNEDHFIVEVIDPDDGRPLAPGTEGELVFTTLTKEALPLLRYRTRDIGTVLAEPCECGTDDGPGDRACVAATTTC